MLVDGVSGSDDRLFPGSVNITLKPALVDKAAPKAKVTQAEKTTRLSSAINDSIASAPVSPTKSVS